jgi:GNAT superfamily N-acetyltransferase
MDPVIRRATIDDAEALFGLAEAFAISFKPARDAFQRSLSELLGDDSVWLAVAEWRGTVAGYCLGFDHYTFYANGRVSWVEEITVKPELQRKGLGRALMEAFEHWAASRGSKLVGLATRRAAAFYSALGYESSAVFFRKLL